MACGTQTVDQLPPAGYLSLDVVDDTSLTPADSDLAKVVAPGALCPAVINAGMAQVAVYLYEIDDAGTLLSIAMPLYTEAGVVYYARSEVGADLDVGYWVWEGCLAMGSDPGENPDSFDPIGDTFDVSDDTVFGPCPAGQLAIGRAGYVTDTDATEEYICIEREILDTCLVCFEDAAGWHTRVGMTWRLTALGTLDNIAVSDWMSLCETDDATPVTIHEGDTVTIESATVTTYAPSASPEELGWVEGEWSDDWVGP